MTWETKSTYIFNKQLGYFSTSTSLLYIPITNTFSENTDSTNFEMQFLPTNKGWLKSLSVSSSASPGATIFTLRDSGGVIGTKTVTLTGSGAVDFVDFTTGLDSGTNEFDGTKMIQIGCDVTSSASSINFMASFKINL